MPFSAEARRLTRGGWLFRLLMGLASVFLAIAALFVFAPRTGALVYGIPVQAEPWQPYIRAIGFRDLALALYLGLLALFSDRRSLALVLGATVVIPLGDLAIVSGAGADPVLPYLLLHGASGLVFAGLAWLVGRRSP